MEQRDLFTCPLPSSWFVSHVRHIQELYNSSIFLFRLKALLEECM